jgi:hypothetical protein
MLMIDIDFWDFKVVDDATGQELKDVRWIDPQALEYAVIAQPYRFVFGTFNLAVDVTKVTAVRVDYVNRVIHVNEPAPVTAGITVRELDACAECCQETTCSRINYCAAGRCNFGEFARP